MKLQAKNIRRALLVIVPVTALLISYQNCSPGYDISQGPRYDSEGNLIPPPGFSSGTEAGDSSSNDSNSSNQNNLTNSDSGDVADSSDSGNNDDSENNVAPGKPHAPKCVLKNISAKQRARKSANAFGLAKKFLQERRCNSFLSGPKGQARKLLHEASIENFCLSDVQNTLKLLRQVGRQAGMQDVDQYNNVERWIDCFCNVTGKAICPQLAAKKPKDVYDIQDHFVDPKKRKPAMKLEDIPLNEDDVSGVDEVLND